MQAIFIKLIEQLNGAVFVLIAILVLAFFICYKVACVVTKFSIVEESNKKFDGNIDKINYNLASVKATVDLLYKKELETAKSQSPMTLTPKGIEVATNIKAREKVMEHWEEIKNFLSEKNLTNPYDIQVECMEKAQRIFENIFTQTERSEIKLYAFKIGMDLLEIYPIFAIKIRNKILEEKGINIEEIDKYDPKAK